MNVRTVGGGGDLSPELLVAMTAAVQAFIRQEPGRSIARHARISAWRRVAHAGFDSVQSGWRKHD